MSAQDLTNRSNFDLLQEYSYRLGEAEARIFVLNVEIEALNSKLRLAEKFAQIDAKAYDLTK